MKKYVLSFYVLLCLFPNVRPQSSLSIKEQAVDSLLTKVSKEIRSVSPEQGLEFAVKALSQSRESNYSKGKAMSCFYIGQLLFYFGDYNKSLQYLSLSEQEEYTSGNYILLSEISRIKGQLYSYLKLKEASFSELKKAYGYALQIREKKERERFTSLAYENLAIAFNIRGDQDSSFFYLMENKKLLARTDENKTFNNAINLYTLFGEYFGNKQQYDSATYYFNNALALISKHDYPYTSWLYGHWGDLYSQKNESDSALFYYRKALQNLKETNLKNEFPNIYQKISEIYSLKGIEDSATLYNEKYLLISSELRDAKDKATEQALQILLKEERHYAQIEQQRILTIIGIILVFISILILLYGRHWNKKKKKILEEKEKEVTDLQSKLNESLERVLTLAQKNDPAFLPLFRKVYPQFSQNIFQKYSDLTPSEFQLCALIFLDFTSKEIAQYTFVTHRSVQTSKSRLRKKFEIDGQTDLYQYIKSFG
ncbi:MAG TPA: hypothetical protein DDZ96_14355 [Porphyromonadaceae bacterium]|jgi:DNA-binding CsgD family transcriptional regulator/predicted negative regulator of RcsB-dependent stress response/cell division protein FtsL|nr:hypothetical protein [Porphyromonadaceae bacterium]HBX21216.1 hypothetical protein [Porphyromonadaceae bacterium]HCM20594.1 hypothetical protein [Porphyromonadaceae bacterium]